MPIWLALAVGPPLLVAATPGPLFGRPRPSFEAPSELELRARAQAFDDRLEREGLTLQGDVLVPVAGPSVSGAVLADPPHRATIFLNFFGAARMGPGTNAALDQSTCLTQAIAWPPFDGTEEEAMAIVEVFERNLSPYGIRVVYEERPPAHLPYTMVMIGGSPGLLGMSPAVLGISCSTDCADRWWRDTIFAFSAGIDLDEAGTLAATALHEAGHAFGLAHISDPSRIMYPYVRGDDVSWATTCTPFDTSTGPTHCGPTHDAFCDGAGQNSAAELLAYFGPAGPDVQPPRVEILTPADGTELPTGGSVEVEVEVEDDHEGFGWRLVIPESDQEIPAFRGETRWTLKDLPRGVYTLRVDAIDHDRNEGSDEVRIYVGVPAPRDADAAGSCACSPAGGNELALLWLSLGAISSRRRRAPAPPPAGE